MALATILVAGAFSRLGYGGRIAAASRHRALLARTLGFAAQSVCGPHAAPERRCSTAPPVLGAALVSCRHASFGLA